MLRARSALRSRPAGVVATILGTSVLTAVLAPMHDQVGLLNEGLLFLLLTLLLSATWGREVGLFAAVLANLALNFFFVPPLYRFTVQAPANVVALGVFLVVSVVGSSLLSSARRAADEARRREAETQVLLGLSRALIGQTEPTAALAALCREVVDAFAAAGASVLSAGAGGFHVLASAGRASAARAADAQERVMAERAVSLGAITRLGHTSLGGARQARVVLPAGQHRIKGMEDGIAFVPLRIADRTVGVLRLDGPIGVSAFREHPDQLLTAFAGEAALGVQRAELAQAASHADALKQAGEMKTALMTSISHDLKTPLAGIKTAVSSLLDTTVRWSPDDVDAFLSTIDSQADRLNRVISDILDLNRIESGVIAPLVRPADARRLLEEAAERTALVTGDRRVIIDAPPDLHIEADRSLLLQALVNLIENAAKYSTPGGSIKLRARAAGPMAELSAEDEGPGIPPGDLPHVFERFYRAAEQSRRVKGSGLGLAIVKGFVTLSGGTVRVESSPSATRFVIELPLAKRATVSA
ncbi:MAG: sensor histidine kinase [Dehalococcoidia bacterium]